MRSTEASRFLYLIQEYEPFTFPMGTFAALAEQSYRFPHIALFSSELLRGYFRQRRIGVFAAGTADGDRDSVAFENALTAVTAPPADELAARRTRRLLFYARPEPHAARNMYELGVLGLERALREGLFRTGWELNGIGTVERRGRRLTLTGGATLTLLPRSTAIRVRGTAAPPRHRPRADVHPAPKPRPARDGLGGNADRDQQLREQDGGGARGDLAEPDRG